MKADGLLRLHVKAATAIARDLGLIVRPVPATRDVIAADISVLRVDLELYVHDRVARVLIG